MTAEEAMAKYARGKGQPAKALPPEKWCYTPEEVELILSRVILELWGERMRKGGEG